MLSIPVYAEIEKVTIFRDDKDLGRFFYLPGDPTLKRGPDGRPMFTYLFYQLPIERQAGGDRGGAYLVFTTQMRLDPEVQDRIEAKLRAKVAAEQHDPPLEVKLGPVDFTAGEARLLIMDNDKFVGSVELGRPSMFADNSLSVAVELPELGAQLFRDALRRGGSIGAIEYDLEFPVRLPAVQITGTVDSKHVKEVVMTYTTSQVRSDDTWGNEEQHTEAHRTSIAASMEEQGLISLTIDKGSVDLTEEDMESLRGFALRAMDEFVNEHFLKGGTVATEADRESQWMTFLGEDIRAEFHLDVTFRDVITRRYSPSAQINPSFLGTDIEDLVLDIDLANAPWYYNNLAVNVSTNLDFDRYGDIVHSVVGHLSYERVTPEGERLVKRESVAFTKGDAAPKREAFKTRLAGVGEDAYHVDVEVNYKSGPVAKTRLASFDATTRDLTLAVPNPGIVDVRLATEPNAFATDRLAAVEVEIEYGDPVRGVAQVTETVVLSKGKEEVDYRRPIYAPWDKPFRWRPTYILTDENGSTQRTSGSWVERGAPSLGDRAHVRVSTPFDTMFDLRIVPQVDWHDVRELIVDLDYHDELHDYRQQKTVSFSEDAGGGSVSWQFPLRDEDRRSFRYSQKLLMVNGAVQSKEWRTVESDSDTLAVGNAPGGVATIEVDATDADIGRAVRRVIVRLAYTDPANGVTDTETMLFRNGDSQDWTIAMADAAVRDYTFDVDYVMSDGSIRRLHDQQGSIAGLRDFLFIPAAPAA